MNSQSPADLPRPRQRASQTPARDLARTAVDALLEKRGLDLQVLGMHESGLADYFVIGTGQSELQLRAMADGVQQALKEEYGEAPWHVEGTTFMQWVVIDYVDVVVHLFLPEKRAFYGLERLWGDAPSELVPDTATGADVALLREG